MTDHTTAAQADNKEIRAGFELCYAVDANDPANITDLGHFTNGWHACIISQSRAPVAGEARMPPGYQVKTVDGHGYRITPPTGGDWIAHSDTPAGDFMAALLAAPQAREADAAALSTAVDYRRMEDTQFGASEHLAKLAAALGNRDWKWWDSCSFRRLTFADGPDRRDGGALCGWVQPSDGHPDVSMAPGVREFIEAASPKAIAALVAAYMAALSARPEQS